MSGSGESHNGRTETRKSSARSWYDVLEVAPSASADEIAAAYRRALKIVEGQSVGGYLMLDPMAQQAARKELEAAYAVLNDPARRQEFDDELRRRPELPPPAPSSVSATAATTPPGGADADADSRRRRRRRRRGKSKIADARTEAPSSDRIEVIRDDAPTLVPNRRAAPPGDDRRAAPMPDRRVPVAPERSPAPSAPVTSKKPAGFGLRFLTPVVEDAVTEPAAPASDEADENAPTLVETAPPSAVQEAGDIPDEGEIGGLVIRRVREAQGVTLEELSTQTHIRKAYLIAIEEAVVEDLPARVYLRGFLTQIARVLKVDKKRLADGYLEFLDRHHHGG